MLIAGLFILMFPIELPKLAIEFKEGVEFELGLAHGLCAGWAAAAQLIVDWALW